MTAIDQDFVRDIIERHSDASGGNGRDFHNGAYAAMADEIAQAIAATLGAGTCHPKPYEQWTTVLLPEIAWDWDDRWPDYLSVAHDVHGEWRIYIPEATLGTGTCELDDFADGGAVSETYIRPAEEGSICPTPRASVIFEGQKLTFDEEDSARFAEIVKRHLRKLAGVEDA